MSTTNSTSKKCRDCAEPATVALKVMTMSDATEIRDVCETHAVETEARAKTPMESGITVARRLSPDARAILSAALGYV